MKNNRTISISEYFQWQRHPFSDTYAITKPFLSSQDERIADRARSLINYGKSFAITGTSGTGKSTIIQHIIATMDPKYYHPVLIHYSGLARTPLLRALADKLGVDTGGRAVPLLVKLQKYITAISDGSAARHPVIVLDDAQLAEREALMDLCSLIVDPQRKTTVASLIIVGDKTLAKLLDLDVMTPIRTRMTVVLKMQPLTEQETNGFISHRLLNAKAPKDLFEPDALALISSHCRGNRRVIMNKATMLLEEAYDRNEKTVAAELIVDSDLFD